MTDINAWMVRYEHSSSCSGDNFMEPNERGVKTCIDCAGIFNEKGEGIFIQSKVMDENWVPPSESV